MPIKIRITKRDHNKSKNPPVKLFASKKIKIKPLKIQIKQKKKSGNISQRFSLKQFYAVFGKKQGKKLKLARSTSHSQNNSVKLINLQRSNSVCFKQKSPKTRLPVCFSSRELTRGKQMTPTDKIRSPHSVSSNRQFFPDNFSPQKKKKKIKFHLNSQIKNLLKEQVQKNQKKSPSVHKHGSIKNLAKIVVSKNSNLTPFVKIIKKDSLNKFLNISKDKFYPSANRNSFQKFVEKQNSLTNRINNSNICQPQMQNKQKVKFYKYKHVKAKTRRQSMKVQNPFFSFILMKHRK